jgi:hypothetical protein
MNLKRMGLVLFMVFVGSIVTVFAQTITVSMSDDETGWLTCYEAGVSTKCWFKSTTPLKTLGVYSGQVSYMSIKSRDGIIIFGGPINLSAGKGIFIHKGDSVAWSDNCIVIEEAQMDKLYNYLKSTYGYNGRTFTIRTDR